MGRMAWRFLNAIISIMATSSGILSHMITTSLGRTIIPIGELPKITGMVIFQNSKYMEATI